MDALDAPEGELPMPRTRGKPVSADAMSIGVSIKKLVYISFHFMKMIDI